MPRGKPGSKSARKSMQPARTWGSIEDARKKANDERERKQRDEENEAREFRLLPRINDGEQPIMLHGEEMPTVKRSALSKEELKWADQHVLEDQMFHGREGKELFFNIVLESSKQAGEAFKKTGGYPAEADSRSRTYSDLWNLALTVRLMWLCLSRDVEWKDLPEQLHIEDAEMMMLMAAITMIGTKECIDESVYPSTFQHMQHAFFHSHPEIVLPHLILVAATQGVEQARAKGAELAMEGEPCPFAGDGPDTHAAPTVEPKDMTDEEIQQQFFSRKGWSEVVN